MHNVTSSMGVAAGYADEPRGLEGFLNERSMLPQPVEIMNGRTDPGQGGVPTKSRPTFRRQKLWKVSS